MEERLRSLADRGELRGLPGEGRPFAPDDLTRIDRYNAEVPSARLALPRVSAAGLLASGR